MTVNKDRAARLQELGLTEYESRAYLALLDLEVAEASQVADVARVPRTKIYSALEGLEEKTLVKVVPERPKRYIVQPVTNHIERLENDHRARARELEEQKTRLADEFAPRGEMEAPDTGSFLALKGRSNIASRLVELLDRAESSVTVLTSARGAHRLAYHDHVLREAAERNVRLRVLAPPHEENAEALEVLGELAEVRHPLVPPGPVTLAIVDGREALVVHHVPDDTHVYQGADPALLTDDGGVLALLASLAAGAWALAATAEGPVHAVEGDLTTSLLEIIDLPRQQAAEVTA